MLARGVCSRLAHSRPSALTERVTQTKCGLIVQDYVLAASDNLLEPAGDSWKRLVGTLRTVFTNTIAEVINYPPYFLIGSCFPVAANILCTAKHNVYDSDLLGAGWTPKFIEAGIDGSSKFIQCTEKGSVYKGDFQEFEPFAGTPWSLKRDYLFLKVEGTPFTQYLLPQVIKKEEEFVVPCVPPLLTLENIEDIKFAMEIRFVAGGLTHEEAEAKVQELDVTYDKVHSYISRSKLLHGKGKVRKIGGGLFAHSAPFYKGMSGSPLCVTNTTFGGIGISAGHAVAAPGTTYNIGISVDREDFKIDYTTHVLPHLPKDLWSAVEKSLR